MSPDTPARPYQRRTIVINAPFQYKFVGTVAACVLLAVGIIAVDMFTSLGRYVSENAASLDMAAVYRDSWVALLVKMLVYLVGVCVVSLVVSHRIAGPMYRFERSTEEVASGDLSLRVYIRKGDEWQGFREKFCEMVEALQKKVLEEVARAGTVRKILEEVAADPALPAAAKEKVNRALKEASTIGRQFKLS
jgi:nitrogen fixation/metabolism regulation signal transduction histidine kinase